MRSVTPVLSAPAPARVPLKALMPYLVITFGLAWGVIGSFIVGPELMARMFGELSGRHPLFILSVWAPAIAAVAVVWQSGGADGVWRFLSRLRLWQCGPGWYALLILGIPLVFLSGAAFKGDPATALVNASRGSILLPALLHFQLNNPLWADAQPYETVVLVAVAALVMWATRATMFSREGAVTDVIPVPRAA